MEFVSIEKLRRFWTKAKDSVDKVVIVTFGTTTFAEIQEAFSAGKYIVCKLSGLYYVPLAAYRGTSFVFAGNSLGVDYELTVTNTDEWTSKGIEHLPENSEEDEGKVLFATGYNTYQLKETGNAGIIVKRNISLPASAWAADTTHAAYPYRASIDIIGCTAEHVPFVTFSVSDTTGGNFCPNSATYDGGVYVYAKAIPTATTTSIRIITLLKEV